MSMNRLEIVRDIFAGIGFAVVYLVVGIGLSRILLLIFPP